MIPLVLHVSRKDRRYLVRNKRQRTDRSLSIDCTVGVGRRRLRIVNVQFCLLKHLYRKNKASLHRIFSPALIEVRHRNEMITDNVYNYNSL